MGELAGGEQAEREPLIDDPTATAPVQDSVETERIDIDLPNDDGESAG